MNHNEWIEDLQETRFLYELLETLIQRGLGVLPAREVAISTIELILNHYPGWKSAPPTAYELSRMLRISPRRLRGYLDEISFRNQSIDNQMLEQRLSEKLTKIETIKEGEWVIFEIEDGLLRSFAQQKVRENFGVFESGISGSIIKISSRQYGALCISMLSKEKAKVMLQMLNYDPTFSSPTETYEKPLHAKVLEAFLVAAGSQAGKKLVDLGLVIATGGFSEIGRIPIIVEEILKKSNSFLPEIR